MILKGLDTAGPFLNQRSKRDLLSQFNTNFLGFQIIMDLIWSTANILFKNYIKSLIDRQHVTSKRSHICHLIIKPFDCRIQSRSVIYLADKYQFFR